MSADIKVKPRRRRTQGLSGRLVRAMVDVEGRPFHQRVVLLKTASACERRGFISDQGGIHARHKILR